MLGTSFLLFKPLEDLLNWFMRMVYGLYFGVVRAIGLVLDALTQLFFIFAGLTPVGTSKVDAETGEVISSDIVQFFLTQKRFTQAYLWLCLIALGLVIVFTIAKIIKQDYFDRSGPRSKGPIFRSVALSFIAFICVVPIFLFIAEVAGALALAVMRAMGYEGGGVGTMLFNLCWEDGGQSVNAIAEAIDGVNDNGAINGAPGAKVYSYYSASRTRVDDNMYWMSIDTFYAYYWDPSKGEAVSSSAPYKCEFYWYIFLVAGVTLVFGLGTMLLAMVTRIFNLLALFIVAPSPISQIVLDDGKRFSGWKDRVIQESLKVVGCVMSFMLFIMIATAINDLDIMMFAFEPESATAKNIIDSNNVTVSLGNTVSALYYGGDTASGLDHVLNAIGKSMFLLAGMGAIKDIDATITPFLYGGKSSMELGESGKALAGVAGGVAKTSLDIGKAGLGLATNLATKAVGLGGRTLGRALTPISNGIKDIFDNGKAKEEGRAERAEAQRQQLSNQLANMGNGSGGGNNPTDPNNPNNNSDQATNPSSPGGAGGANPGGSPGGNDVDTPEIAEQRAKVEDAKARMDSASDVLNSAREAANKKRDIQNNIDTIEGTTTMGATEKAQRLKELNDEMKELEDNSTSLTDAHNDFDRTSAVYEMEKRKLDEMTGGGEASEEQQTDAADATAMDANAGSNASNVNSANSGTADNDNAASDNSSATENSEDKKEDKPERRTTLEEKVAGAFKDAKGAVQKGLRKNVKDGKWYGNLARATGRRALDVGKFALGTVGDALKTGKGLVGTALKTGGSTLSMAAKTLTQTFMQATSGSKEVAGMAGDAVGAVTQSAANLGKGFADTGKELIVGKKDEKTGKYQGGLVGTARGLYNAKKARNDYRAEVDEKESENIALQQQIAQKTQESWHSEAGNVASQLSGSGKEATDVAFKAAVVESEAASLHNNSAEAQELAAPREIAVRKAQEEMKNATTYYDNAREAFDQAMAGTDVNAQNAASNHLRGAEARKTAAETALRNANNMTATTAEDKRFKAWQDMCEKSRSYAEALQTGDQDQIDNAKAQYDASKNEHSNATAKVKNLTLTVATQNSKKLSKRKRIPKPPIVDASMYSTKQEEIMITVKPVASSGSTSGGSSSPKCDVGQSILRSGNAGKGKKVTVKVNKACDSGRVDRGLGNACDGVFNGGYIKDLNNQAEVSSVMNNMTSAISQAPSSADGLTGINETNLLDAISSIQSIPEKDKEALKKENIEKVDEYKDSLRAKLRSEVSGYENAIEKARVSFSAFRSSGGKDKLSLEAAKRFIAEAISHNAALNDLKDKINQ